MKKQQEAQLPDLDDILGKRQVGYQRCQTCVFAEESPEFAADIAKVVEAYKAGKARNSRKAVFDWLKAAHPEYRSTMSAFRSHLAHEGVPNAR